MKSVRQFVVMTLSTLALSACSSEPLGIAPIDFCIGGPIAALNEEVIGANEDLSVSSGRLALTPTEAQDSEAKVIECAQDSAQGIVIHNAFRQTYIDQTNRVWNISAAIIADEGTSPELQMPSVDIAQEIELKYFVERFQSGASSLEIRTIDGNLLFASETLLNLNPELAITNADRASNSINGDCGTRNEFALSLDVEEQTLVAEPGGISENENFRFAVLQSVTPAADWRCSHGGQRNWFIERIED